MSSESLDPRVIEALFKVEAMAGDMNEVKVAIREMAQAVSRLAVVEERQSQANAAIGRAFTELDKHDGRIRTLEEVQPLQKRTTEWVDKVMWLVVGAVVSAVISTVVINRAPSASANPPVITAPR